jgi:hypothetical protein
MSVQYQMIKKGLTARNVLLLEKNLATGAPRIVNINRLTGQELTFHYEAKDFAKAVKVWENCAKLLGIHIPKAVPNAA